MVDGRVDRRVLGIAELMTVEVGDMAVAGGECEVVGLDFSVDLAADFSADFDCAPATPADVVELVELPHGPLLIGNPAPPTVPDWDWGLFLAAAGTVVTTAGVVVGWVTAILRNQFRDLEKDLTGIGDRSRERFDQQEAQLSTLFDLVRELDGKYVPRGEFERELDRTRTEVAQLRGSETVWVGRLEARIQELSDRSERNFQEIREELRGRSAL